MPDQGPNPGIVDVITKSGTNSFHGEAYDFIRNTALNAANFFATQPQILHRNQFGFALGAPVIIPKVWNGQNKLWFHFAYEGTRQIQNFLSSGYAPTQAMLNGDFSAEASPIKIYNPYTYNSTTGQRSPFARNIIPSSQINPVSQKLLAYYLPGSSYTQTPSNFSRYPRNPDTAINARQSLFATVSHGNSPVVQGGLMPLSGATFPLIADLAVLQHTSSIGLNMVNIARIGFDLALVSISIPVIIYDPRLPASIRGTRHKAMTLNIDLHPTVLELAGLKPSSTVQCRSLAPMLHNKPTDERHIWFIEHHIIAGLSDVVAVQNRGTAAGISNSLGWPGGGLAPSSSPSDRQ